MAFRKLAKAYVSHPIFGADKWQSFIEHHQRQLVSRGRVASAKNLSVQASEILEENFDPSQYLLTHCTIVASVDVEEAPMAKTGRVTDAESGETIMRKWADYRIVPQTLPWINNNNDAWSRPVLMKSYRTFIGGHNFCEHVQIEAQSKGRIIDAVARDIGPSVYTDILLATNRKHAQLIRDIEEQKLTTLSMGCTVLETQCSKCGNVAKDETDFCQHIRYEKGNTFYDERGMPNKIAELCGHSSMDPTGGVQFIEASWVGTPAFTGAVLRNIVRPEEINTSEFQKVLESVPKKWNPTSTIKAARNQVAEDFGFGDDAGGDSAETAEAPKAEKDPLKEVEDELEQTMVDRVKKRIQDRLQKEEQQKSLKPEGELATSTDSNVFKEASRRVAYQTSLDVMARTAKSDVALISQIALLNRRFGIYIPNRIYRASLKVGSTSKYRSLPHFLKTCRSVLGVLTPEEATTLVRLGHLLNKRNSVS